MRKLSVLMGNQRNPKLLQILKWMREELGEVKPHPLKRIAMQKLEK